MASPESPRELKNILINPSFQIKLLSYFAGLFFLTTASLYGTLYLFIWRFKEKALKVGIPEGHVFFDFLSYQQHDLNNLFMILVAVNFVILLLVGFILSHRIAGPIHKLKRHLGQQAPASEPFKLREHDFFRELEPIVQQLKDREK